MFTTTLPNTKVRTYDFNEPIEKANPNETLEQNQEALDIFNKFLSSDVSMRGEAFDPMNFFDEDNNTGMILSDDIEYLNSLLDKTIMSAMGKEVEPNGNDMSKTMMYHAEYFHLNASDIVDKEKIETNERVHFFISVDPNESVQDKNHMYSHINLFMVDIKSNIFNNPSQFIDDTHLDYCIDKNIEDDYERSQINLADEDYHKYFDEQFKFETKVNIVRFCLNDIQETNLVRNIMSNTQNVFDLLRKNSQNTLEKLRNEHLSDYFLETINPKDIKSAKDLREAIHNYDYESYFKDEHHRGEKDASIYDEMKKYRVAFNRGFYADILEHNFKATKNDIITKDDVDNRSHKYSLETIPWYIRDAVATRYCLYGNPHYQEVYDHQTKYLDKASLLSYRSVNTDSVEESENLRYQLKDLTDREWADKIKYEIEEDIKKRENKNHGENIGDD